MKIDQFVRTGAMTYDEAITLEHLIRREQALRESGVTKPLPKEKRAEVSDGWQQHVRPLDAADREALRRCDEAWGVDKPVAWRVRPSPTETCYFDGEEAAKEFAFRQGTGARPLFLQPVSKSTLTDEERKAISRVYDLLCDRSRELQSATRLDEARPLIQWAKTLQGLWERLSGSV